MLFYLALLKTSVLYMYTKLKDSIVKRNSIKYLIILLY